MYRIRAHAKSRSGCKACKRRRVKCDETKPQCGGCLRHETECIYLPITKRKATVITSNVNRESPVEGQKTPPSPRAQDALKRCHHDTHNLLDLRLMHQYCVFTTRYFAATFPEEVSVSLKVDLPKLAFKHGFLMDAILLVGIIHLGCSDPVMLEEGLPVALYRDRALSGLRRAVTLVSFHNADAIRGASVLLATVSFAADRISGEPELWILNWLTLAFGQRNFRSSRPTPTTSPVATPDATPALHAVTRPRSPFLYGSFEDIMLPATIPTSILEALEKEQESIDSADRDVLIHAAGELGKLISALRRPYDSLWLEKKVKTWGFDVVLPEFCTMVRDKKPYALIIVAHYLVLFKLLPNSWVYEGLADHDITFICHSLNQDWQEYIAVPRIALQTANNSEIASLLLQCLGPYAITSNSC